MRNERIKFLELDGIILGPATQTHERLQAVTVRPDVVHRIRRGAAQLGQVLQQIRLGIVQRGAGLQRVPACLHQCGNTKRGHRQPKGIMALKAGRINIEALGVARAAP